VVPLADPAAKRTETAWPRWAVAAALLVGLLPSLVLLQRSPRVERVEVPAAGGTIAELALHVPTTRGSEAPKLQVPAKAEWVRVSLDVEAGYEFYEVRVESAGSGLAFSQGIKSGPPLTVTIPTKALAAGAYDFVVSGRKGSETALLATYACVVER
jgi:hypothetical protein